jgi:hypothetical protein
LMTSEQNPMITSLITRASTCTLFWCASSVGMYYASRHRLLWNMTAYSTGSSFHIF